jgi:hypothetical protein
MSPNRDAGRDAPLYHAAPWYVVERVLHENRLKGTRDAAPSPYNVKGVSLTRDFQFASRWKQDHTAVFVLDQRKLAQRYKLIPRDYLIGGHGGKYAEAEEFVPGDITDLVSVLDHVDVPVALRKVLRQILGQGGSWKDAGSREEVVPFIDAVLSIGTANSEQQQDLVDIRSLATGGRPSVKEAGRDAPLYHRADVGAAPRILAMDTIMPGADGNVSLTRNRDFAETFRGGGVIFVLDQAKLAQRNKLTPYDFFSTHPMEVQYRSPGSKGPHRNPERRRNESEEFVHGEIANLNGYLTRIYVSPQLLPQIMATSRPWITKLAEHPKFDPKQRALIMNAGPIKQMQQKFLPGLTKVPSTHPMLNKASIDKDAGRDAPLYHGTTVAGAAGIITSDTLNASKNPRDTHLGVSFTRDRDYAATAGHVLLRFDQRRMVQDYKFKTFDWYQDRPERRREQSEEVLIGDLYNVNLYLQDISYTSHLALADIHNVIAKLPTKTWQSLINAVDSNTRIILTHKRFNTQQKFVIKRWLNAEEPQRV